jgi:hypothetical protein
MKRIARRIGVASLTFAVGLTCVLLPAVVSQVRGFFEEPVVEPPPLALKSDELKCLEFYDEANTPDDFGQFWSAFKAGIGQNDREKLYPLIAHDGFSWEPGGIYLPIKTCGEYDPYYPTYLIKNFDQFSRNYELLFPDSFKKAILTQAPTYEGDSSYVLGWADRKGPHRGSFSLYFQNTDGRGYKLVGALMGPAPDGK